MSVLCRLVTLISGAQGCIGDVVSDKGSIGSDSAETVRPPWGEEDEGRLVVDQSRRNRRRGILKRFFGESAGLKQ